MKTIGITKCDSSFENYPNWIKESKEDITIVVLDYNVGNVEDASRCDGIVFSGGVDVHPRFYSNERLDYPNADIFNEKRDEFEKKVFDIAQEKKMPILGICRGMQYINILMGGGLVQDLQEVKKEDHKSYKDELGQKKDREHEITIEKNSLFYEISHQQKGKVNSAHHQGLGKIADELIVTAVSDDNVPEVIEYKDKNNKPWLLCVQWHPERLKIEQALVPFSKNIRESFLASIKK